MKKEKNKEKGFLSVLFNDEDFKVNDKIFDEDDTTFNELKDRTEELTNELIMEAKEEKKEKRDSKKEELTIVSSFPKLDRLGSVVPHKIK